MPTKQRHWDVLHERSPDEADQKIRRAIQTAKPAPIKRRRFSPACAAPKSAFITTSAGPYSTAYASEMAWRENNRRVSNGEQYLMTTSAALTHPVVASVEGVLAAGIAIAGFTPK